MKDEIIYFISDHSILIIIWILLLVGIVFTIIQEKILNIKEIIYEELVFLINKKNAVVLDLRDKKDYINGHIINSINMKIEDIKSKKFDFLKNNPLVIICNNSISSRKPAKLFLQLGFRKVYILKDGISRWNKKNFPLVRSS